MFDVGDITRRIQAEFRLFCPGGAIPAAARNKAQGCAESTTNRATPANILILLDELDDVTAAVLAEVNESGISPAARIGFLISLSAWRERLGKYRERCEAAAPDDRAAIVWDVTAPLLLGLYGGEQSNEPRRVIDAVTPFMLANQQEVDDEFRDELWSAFLEDLKTNAADIVKPLAVGFGFGALALGGLALLLVLRR